RRVGVDRGPRRLAVVRLGHRERSLQDVGKGRADEAGIVHPQHAALPVVGRRRHRAHSSSSTTTRRVTLPPMKSSNTVGSWLKGTVRAISLRRGGLRSVPRRFHTRSRTSFELSPELIPSRRTPRRMKGITLVLRLGLAARAIEAMTAVSF